MRGAGTLILMLAVSGCVVGAERRPSSVESGRAPPPPAEERSATELVTSAAPTPARPPPGPKPSPDAVWVEGSWHWNGVKYVWLPGRWERSRPPYRWQED